MSGLTMNEIAERTFPKLNGEKYYRSDIPRIDPDKKHVWTEALEDDEKYKQGKNMLKTPEGNFCCLGVYCAVAGVPEHEEYGVYNHADKGPINGSFPTFGDKEVRGEDGITRDMTNAVMIPEGYRIKYVNPPEPDCSASWYEFVGDEDIFYCREQGHLNPITGESFLWPFPDEARVIGWALPTLNDSGEFSFSQIRDIIDYFL